MIKAILEIVVGVLAAIPYFDKWFSKTPTQKVEEGKEDVRRETDEFRRTGRPPK